MSLSVYEIFELLNSMYILSFILAVIICYFLLFYVYSFPFNSSCWYNQIFLD